MSEFYNRYKKSCQALGMEPCSQSTAEKIGVTRSAIGSWSANGMIPKGEALARIADVLHVSSDYLLARTNIPMDCNEYNNLSPELAILLEKAARLNETGLLRMESYLDGLLTAEQNRKTND